MTTTPTVERIDVLECPNLEGLQLGLTHSEEYRDGDTVMPPLSVRFEEVRFFDADSREVTELGRIYLPYIVGIVRLGKMVASGSTLNQFVVTTWTPMGTFQGHLDVYSRKGSLVRIG